MKDAEWLSRQKGGKRQLAKSREVEKGERNHMSEVREGMVYWDCQAVWKGWSQGNQEGVWDRHHTRGTQGGDIA